MFASRFDLTVLGVAMDAGNGTFLDHVATSPNLRRAFRRVVANAGAPGSDGRTVQDLVRDWPQLKPVVARSILDGSYTPAPVRRCDVPKPGGGVRTLGIPTVLDRLVQQAVAQPLGELLDPGFSSFSFGFRPGRSAHHALLQAARFVAGGARWVLHLDLEKFFDRAPHDLVLAALARQVPDEPLCWLVERFLTAAFALPGGLSERRTGLPQGGPLSPLLANLLLDGLDRRLQDAGFEFCRYADDICLYFASATQAREAFAMVAPWIEGDLRLPLNRKKTRIVPVEQDVLLGYRLIPSPAGVRFLPSSESCARLRLALLGVFRRARRADPDTLFRGTVTPLLRGWAEYFALASDWPGWRRLDRWVRSEARGWLWRQARRPGRRARELIARGVPEAKARACTRAVGPVGRLANIGWHRRAYSDAWLRRRGLEPGRGRRARALASPGNARLAREATGKAVVRQLGIYGLRVRLRPADETIATT